MVIKIYHGTPYRNIKKFYGKKVRANLDFGSEIYCTTYLDQAKEWSCKYNKTGAVYESEIDLNQVDKLVYQQKMKTWFIYYICVELVWKM